MQTPHHSNKPPLHIDKLTLEVMSEVSDILQHEHVYLVGGSVRDILLGTQPNDYDFTTPLLPNDIEAAIKIAGKKAHTSGKRFGTIGCTIKGFHVEITTFRTEEYSPGSRKPNVEFVQDITADLSRRDFTVNAMAIRAGTHHLIDPFEGYSDVLQKIVRAVNTPGERFNEDPLRMLRAARFVATFNFSIDPETLHGIRTHASEILRISKERWVRELDLLLLAKNPSLGLSIIADTRLLHYMIPELGIQVGFDQDSPYHELDLWQHTLKTVDLVESEIHIRWAALLHDVGKPFTAIKNARGYHNYPDHEFVGAEMVWKIGKYLRWGNQRLEIVFDMVKDHLSDNDSPLASADSAARYSS